MVAYTEPAVLTLMDMIVIIGVIISLFAIPALLAGKRLTVAAMTALATSGAVVANLLVHKAVSLLHSL